MVTLPEKEHLKVSAIVRYSGEIGDESGCFFGVETMDSGKHGTSDGTYQGTKYFSCKSGCGLFVDLASLSPSLSQESKTEMPLQLHHEAPKTSEEQSKLTLAQADTIQSSASLQLKESSKEQTSSNDLETATTDGQDHSQSESGVESKQDFSADSQLQQALCSVEELKQKIESSRKQVMLEKQTFLAQEKVYEVELKKLNQEAKAKEDRYESIVQQWQQQVKSLREDAWLKEYEFCQQVEDLQKEINSCQQKVDAEKRRTADVQEQLQSHIEEMRLTIQKKDNLLQEREKGLVATKASLRANELEIAAKNDVIAARESQIVRVTKEIAELQKKLDAEKNSDLTRFQQSSLSWSIPRAEIQSLPKEEIGLGAWGVVYSAKFKGESVAIKQAHRQLLHKSTVSMLKREIMIMAHIQHPNLVRFIAAVLDSAVEKGTDTPIIISELMDMNLRDAYARVNLTSQHKSIFCDVAYALHYLHQHRPSIIHRDVSAPNVLLKALPQGGYRAKVSDFGSANLAKHSKTAGAGAIVYCAPEMFPSEDVTKPPQPQTTKVDVFSYGILLLEVVVQEMPTPESRYTLLQKAKTQWSVVYDLIIHCTKPLPSDRPIMADILNRLTRVSL